MISAIQGLDIYLLDQILKGRFLKTDRILDAGSGLGRNMTWFYTEGFDIYGCDLNQEALEELHQRIGIPYDKLTVAGLDKLPYADQEFDAIICSAVLHFARSQDHFLAMISELIRVLKPEGTLFVRMTADFGLPQNYVALGNGRFLLADGSERFLVTKDLFNQVKSQFGLEQLEPLKSTLVEELRSMSTWVMRKNSTNPSR